MRRPDGDSTTPRVAFFTDSFHEVNGVALTSREFDRFARRRGHPFLSVHAGGALSQHAEGDHLTIECPHSPFSVGLERGLGFDPLFWRHREYLRKELEMFQPDLIHVTGPGHLGCLGAILAWNLGVPLVASWHTNVHEFAGRRLSKLLWPLPHALRGAASRFAERNSLDIIMNFYRFAKLHFAPNPELVELLAERTGTPGRLMLRGVDTGLFTPTQRARNDTDFVIGYVGRLSPEKNVRLLAQLERDLTEAGVENLRFLIVGDGSEWDYLAANLRRREMPGVLTGTALSRAYANMDAFVFPSETDTFGNVVLEALASGVPVIVSGRGARSSSSAMASTVTWRATPGNSWMLCCCCIAIRT